MNTPKENQTINTINKGKPSSNVGSSKKVNTIDQASQSQFTHKKNSLSINQNLLNSNKKSNQSLNNSVDESKNKTLHTSQSNPSNLLIKPNS